MPRGSAPGEKRSAGRPPGSPNKATWVIEELLSRKKADPHEMMIDIMLGNVECNVCRGTLRTKYVLEPGTHTKECHQVRKEAGSDICECNGIGERECASCKGSGYEKISPDLRGKMAAELAQYKAPKRKAVEHTGAEGGPINHSLVVEFIGPVGQSGKAE